MGCFRVILAIAVMFDHMLTPSGERLNIIFGSLTAVRVFFIISGFYMSLIYITKYSNHKNGTNLFYSNRALRLYPTYIAILVLVTTLDGMVGRDNLFLNGNNWGFPEFLIILSNICILGLDALVFAGSADHLVIGPAWSLGAEFIFYLMVPFIILNRPFVIGTLIVGSIIVRIYFDVSGYSNYNFFPSNLIFFLLGNMGYLVFSRIKNYEMSRYLGIGGVTFFIAYIVYKGVISNNFFLNFLDPGVHTMKGCLFYLTIALSIPFLFLVSKDSRIDRYVGNLSYSIYLLGGHVMYYSNILGRDYPYFKQNHLVVLIFTIVLAWCIYTIIERPVEAIRKRRIQAGVAQVPH